MVQDRPSWPFVDKSYPNNANNLQVDLNLQSKLVLENFKFSSGDLQRSKLEHFFIKSKAWQTDPSNKRDMITHERFLSGFEWPCIMWINFKEDGPTKDVVMRAVSTLVKVNLPDSEDVFYKQEWCSSRSNHKSQKVIKLSLLFQKHTT